MTIGSASARPRRRSAAPELVRRRFVEAVEDQRLFLRDDRRDVVGHGHALPPAPAGQAARLLFAGRPAT